MQLIRFQPSHYKFIRMFSSVCTGFLLCVMTSAGWGQTPFTGTVGESDVPGTIKTVAGGLFTDYGPATQNLILPDGITLDSKGNLYITDSEAHHIFKVNPLGIMTVEAGQGVRWPDTEVNAETDGIHATHGVIRPSWITSDESDNLYFADIGYQFGLPVRKISPDGILTNLNTGYRFSPPESGLLNDVVGLERDRQGAFYTSLIQEHQIMKTTSDGGAEIIAGSRPGFTGDGGPAKEARLASPRGLAVDTSGNLYIADWGNQRIRKVDTAGTISTVAGNPKPDPLIRFKPGYSGDGGPATQAELYNPVEVESDDTGNLYIVEALESGSRIRKVDSSQTITTLIEVPFRVGEIAVRESGVVYVVVKYGVVRLERDGTLTRVAGFDPPSHYPTSRRELLKSGLGEGVSATSAALGMPTSVAMDPRGNLYVSDSQCIRKITRHGIISTYAGIPSPDGYARHGYSGDNGPAIKAELAGPRGIAFDAIGNLYIADSHNRRVRKVNTNGIITTVYDGTKERGFGMPSDVAVDSLGNLYIAFDEEPRSDPCSYRYCKPQFYGDYVLVKISLKQPREPSH